MKKMFLTPERRQLISQFLQDGIKTQALLTMKKEMNGELTQYLDDFVPNRTDTYRKANEEWEIQCPADILNNTLKDLFEDKNINEIIDRQKKYSWRDPRFNLLDDYDDRLKIHVGHCRKCPEKWVNKNSANQSGNQ